MGRFKRPKDSPAIEPYPSFPTLIKQLVVEGTHDHGNWRYVNLDGQGATERATLYVDHAWFKRLPTGTKVEMTIKVMPG